MKFGSNNMVENDKNNGLNKVPFLKSHHIQYAGLFIALIGLIIPLATWLISNERKELSVILKNSKPMLIEHLDIGKDQISVYIGNRKISQPWLVSFRVENSGNTSIEKKDIEIPLELKLHGVIIAAANTGSRSDKNLIINYKIENDRVVVLHSLLNPSDWFEIDLYINGPLVSDIESTARISGITKVNFINENTEHQIKHPAIFYVPQPIIFIASIGTMTIGILILILGFSTGQANIRAIFKPSRESLLMRRLALRPPYNYQSSNESIGQFVNFLPKDTKPTDDKIKLMSDLDKIENHIFDAFKVSKEKIAEELISEIKEIYVEQIKIAINKLLDEHGKYLANRKLKEVLSRDFHLTDIEIHLTPIFDMYPKNKDTTIIDKLIVATTSLIISAIGFFLVLLSGGSLRYSLNM